MWDYVAKVKAKIAKAEWAITDQEINIEYSEDTDLGVFEGRLSFIDGSVFDFVEFLSHTQIKYRFHLMDSNNNLTMRWDNAPHHKEVETFPYHKHTPNGVKKSERKTLLKGLDEVFALVAENLV